MRQQLQQSFLRRSVLQRDAGFLRRTLNGARPDEVLLAPSAGEMSIDELRVCQVWLFGLASRLRACQPAAGVFAEAAGLQDANRPLVGYAEERWDPRAPEWKRMEMCVHGQAGEAGQAVDAVWRRKPAKKAES